MSAYVVIGALEIILKNGKLFSQPWQQEGAARAQDWGLAEALGREVLCRGAHK